MRQHELVGRRVECVSHDDPYTKVRPGDRGTVTFVDDAGTVFVRFDGGGDLGLLPGIDEWRLVDDGS